jgi:hypothetical protein
MMTEKELANDPDIITLSKVKDEMLPLLSPIVRKAILISRRLIAENPTDS